MQFLNTYSSPSIDYMLQILIVHAGTNWKSNTFETDLHSYWHHALKQYIHNTNICQPTQPTLLWPIHSSTYFTPSDWANNYDPPLFFRYLPACPFAPFVWRGKSNLRNCPHRESSKFAQPAEENFSLFSFHFFPAFSRVRFSVCVCVCVPKFICHTVQIHEHAPAYLHDDDDDGDDDDDVHVGDNDDGSDDNMCA